MKQLFVISCLLWIWTACSDSPKSITPAKSIPLSYAQNFTLDSLKEGVLLTIGEKRGRQKLFLLSKRKPRTIPSGTQWIKIPARRILAFAGTDVGMLCRLDLLDRICGVSDRSNVFDNNALRRIRQQKIIDFGQQDQASFEKILLSKANVITYSDFGKDYPHCKELAKANIHCIPILDWKEKHPLGKAEWIKVYGYLCGKEKQANLAFSQSSESYTKLKNKLTFSNKPTVFSGNQTGEIWFCPAGNSYEAQLIADAGGDYIYKNMAGTGSLSLSPEKVLTDNRKTDIWINPGVAHLNELQRKQPRAPLFDAFSKKKIYCYSLNMNKYWEMAACYPERVLEDLIAIFHGQDHRDLHYYQQLR